MILGNVWRVLTHAQPASAFAVRGRAIRTFASMALILTAGLMVLGVYLIADEFRNPLASQSIGLFAAAFVLATAMTLLIDLTQLFRNNSRNVAVRQVVAPPRVHMGAGVRVRHCARYKSGDHRTDLPYQRSYIDRVRVRDIPVK
jgi:hypothetical protein